MEKGGETRPLVLVVGDDDDLRFMIQAALVDAYWLQVAHSVDDGLCKARTEQPDVVLVDRGVADFDAEAVRAFRAEGETPLLVLLAVGDEEVDCADGRLLKPIEPVELEAQVAVLLGRTPQGSGLDRISEEFLSRIETAERGVAVQIDTDASTAHSTGEGAITKNRSARSRAKRPTLEPGDVVADRYRIEELVGRGGMGEVYRVLDMQTGDELAIKLIRADRSEKKSRQRFLEEAQIAAALDNEHIVAIRDFGLSTDERPYFAMDYCRGGTLAQLAKEEGALAPARALAFVLQVLDGLGAAHQQGILHRDIKPGNVMVDANDHVRILDFGLARDLHNPAGAPGRPAVGTPLYMSPEQVVGDPSDQRTDLYAVGVVLYELLCGQPPFRAPTGRQLMQAHLHASPCPPSQLADVTADLDAVVLKALAKDRRERWQSAAEFAAALRGCGCGHS